MYHGINNGQNKTSFGVRNSFPNNQVNRSHGRTSLNLASIPTVIMRESKTKRQRKKYVYA